MMLMHDPEQQPTLGSLTLGGYDSLRMNPNTLSFPLAGNDSQGLVVQLQSITAINTLASEISLLSENVTAIIGTTLPFIWLPLSACLVFEDAFGLIWNASKQLYLVNDTIHQQLQNQNPVISFTLGNMVPGSKSIIITLPYGAFDLQAASPIFANGSNYFPLRRATDETQYTLGRAFLQEAYILVDYEQSNFSVSQAQFPLNTSSSLVTINHSQQRHSNVEAASVTHSSLSKGAIAGITIGSIVGVMLLCTIGFFMVSRYFRRRKVDCQPDPDLAISPSEEEKSWPSSPSQSDSAALAPQILQATVAPIGEYTSLDALNARELDSAIARSPKPPTQELQGSNTSKELPQTPPRELRRKAKHIAELATYD